MDWRDGPDEAAFREQARCWLAGNIPAAWREARGRARGLEAVAETTGQDPVAFAKDWHRRLYDAGFIGLTWPQDYGGRGLGPAYQFIWQEEYSRAKAPPIINTIGLGWAGPAILLHGTEEQRNRYLPKILTGDQIWCQLFSEPGAGSDLAGLGTRAVPIDDGYLVNGQKVWTTYAREADFGILVARTDPDQAKHRGLSFFVCPMDDPGIEVRPIRQMNDSAEFNEVFFTDVRIPGDMLVGELNQGWMVTITTLMHERIGLSLGGGALWGQGPDIHDLVALAQKPVGDRAAVEHPVLRERLAGVVVDAVTHRALKMRMVTTAERGVLPGAEASVQKLFGDAWGQRLTELAVGFQGLYGNVWGPDHAVDGGGWQSGFLFSPALTIGGGTTEVQKNIVGERILGLPREPGT